ncbi:MAG: hypothetical protein GX794_03680 [Acholeplasmataceae bacterium]|nr:hypothetical protein [Acholeplasmataceae bacterium]
MEVKKTNQTLKVFKIIGLVVFYTIILTLLLFAISTLAQKSEDQVPNLFGLGYLTVESNSMEGTEEDSLFVGDLIFVKVLSKKEKEDLDLQDLVDKGAIVTFFDRDPDVRKRVTHRAIGLTEDGLLITKGDNPNTNPTEDAVKRGGTEIIAIYKGRIAGLGKVINFMQSPVGFGVVVVLPMALLLIFQGITLTKNIFKLREDKLKQQLEVEKEALEEEKEREREQLKKELLEELEKERMK